MSLTLLEEKLKVSFKNKELLEEAITHRSYLNEAPDKKIQSNERLEFLGDAVLTLVASNFLYQKFSHFTEGDLTALRASLVKTQTLARVAQKLGLGEFLKLSRGEEGGGRKNPGILADSLEALIGAIFIDQGLPVVTDFISRHIFPLLPEIIKTKSFKDYKSLLQERIQSQERLSPRYQLVKTAGPAHQKTFTVSVLAFNKRLGLGSGRSKQEAEQAAAKAALENLVKIG